MSFLKYDPSISLWDEKHGYSGTINTLGISRHISRKIWNFPTTAPPFFKQLGNSPSIFRIIANDRWMTDVRGHMYKTKIKLKFTWKAPLSDFANSGNRNYDVMCIQVIILDGGKKKKMHCAVSYFFSFSLIDKYRKLGKTTWRVNDVHLKCAIDAYFIFPALPKRIMGSVVLSSDKLYIFFAKDLYFI